MSTSATADCQTDNSRARVTKWQLMPGAETGFHVHEYDYVIIPLTSGPLAITDRDGSRSDAEMVAGVSYYREAGVAHNVINDGPGDITFVEVEIK